MSGSGRGRGWLKLTQTELVRPGIDSKIAEQQSTIIETEKNPYENLIVQLNLLDATDDGILLNNKLKHIRDVFMQLCPTDEDIKKAVREIHRTCLKDEKFLEKIAIFLASAFFVNQQKHEKHAAWKKSVRNEFLNILQENFNNRDIMRKTTPGIFYNSVKICLNYFLKLRNLTFIPNRIEIFASVGYLETLIDYAEPEDLKMFTTIVCESSVILLELYNKKDERLFSILNKMKLVIATNCKISNSQKLLLFFIMDLITHKYSLRSNELEFYKNHLNDDDIKEILMKYVSKLELNESQEINNGKNIDQGEEIVNSILNKTQNIEIEQKDSTISQLKNEKSPTNCQVSINSQNESVESGIKVYEDVYKPRFKLNDRPQENQMGRPILGVGARLKRN